MRIETEYRHNCRQIPNTDRSPNYCGTLASDPLNQSRRVTWGAVAAGGKLECGVGIDHDALNLGQSNQNLMDLLIVVRIEFVHHAPAA